MFGLMADVLATIFAVVAFFAIGYWLLYSDAYSEYKFLDKWPAMRRAWAHSEARPMLLHLTFLGTLIVMACLAGFSLLNYFS